MFPDDIVALANEVLEAAKTAGVKIATAESCTGGLVAGALTAISGSADVVERGFVTYSNEAKTELLGVEAQLIGDVGAVSEPVARAMAKGALANSRADLTVSITGIAGPTGGTPLKPVGLVHFATSLRGGSTRHRMEVFGALGRERVRQAAVKLALSLLLARLREMQTSRKPERPPVERP
ncbi:CinA family protein [Caulobacter sp. 17J80-11]|uniref:CinA family protein n=1 Tax=Caulobacter sp. 17J80-11 TaxID=2763502 RepID=UPI0016537277|nr:CinA family protein [Caulobacter sp. 17J80-11]MBC6980803.1 CinA family protein [Caulobacter sp. 17J80-11]